MNKIVYILDAVLQQKGNYFSPVSIEACDAFLGGFVTECIACGSDDAQRRLWAANTRRGWTDAACGPVPEMREQGLSDEQIMDELITIHIAAFRDENEDDAGSLPGRPLNELS